MEKVKKLRRVILFFIGAFLILFFFQFYWIISNDGNLIIFVSNESMENVEIEVYLDGKKIIEDYFIPSAHDYAKYNIKTNLTNHTLTLKTNNGCIENHKINSLLATWITINYNGIEEGFYFNIIKHPYWSFL